MSLRRADTTVLLASLGLAFLLGCFPMSDFDVWWHLRTARLIAETHAVPRVDVLTYTNAGRPWIDLYWLFQLILAGLYKLGGSSALVLMKATGGALVVFLAWLGRRARGRHWPWMLVWLPALVVLSGRLCERPELFSLIYLAGILTVLAHAPERPRLLWLVPGIQALWANSHGFFVLGPLVLAAYGADWLVERFRPPKTPAARPPWRLAAGAGLAALFACLLNPYGVHVIDLPLQQFHKLGDGGLYRTNVGELKSIGDFIAQSGFSNPYLLSFFFLIGLGIASFGLVWRKRRPSLFRALIFLAGVYLGWQATRNSALFAVITAFVALWNLDEAFPPNSPVPERVGRSRSKKAPARERVDSPTAAILLVVIMALWTLSGSLYGWAGEGRTVGLGERPRWYAHEACAFMARPEMPRRALAFNLGQAGVCSFHLATTQTQFIDPRLEVNRAETFERYIDGMRKLWRGQPDWELPLGIDYAKPDEVPAILVERGILSRAIDVLAQNPRWRQVYADDVAAVFVARP